MLAIEPPSVEGYFVGRWAELQAAAGLVAVQVVVLVAVLAVELVIVQLVAEEQV